MCSPGLKHWLSCVFWPLPSTLESWMWQVNEKSPFLYVLWLLVWCSYFSILTTRKVNVLFLGREPYFLTQGNILLLYSDVYCFAFCFLNTYVMTTVSPGKQWTLFSFVTVYIVATGRVNIYKKNVRRNCVWTCLGCGKLAGTLEIHLIICAKEDLLLFFSVCLLAGFPKTIKTISRKLGGG